ncbi:Cloroperoxidase [Zalerion maritima]|uniref:Cloroperoxidase n=1 Tax=Zalerion maritima TaxID=339359 RepID=A0AAD5S485_9PEZI|nr:Cloroperoxidase [Zalerion maritima]
MEFTILSTALPIALVNGNPDIGSPHRHYLRGSSSEGQASGGDDFRGPCPMMNTLANHGLLPHDGRNITKEVAVDAFNQGLNFDQALGELMFDIATIANPNPNATYFTLYNAYPLTGPNTLDADQLDNSKIARQVQSKAFNPNYNFTSTTEDFSLGEVSAAIIVFGDMESGTVKSGLYFGNGKWVTAKAVPGRGGAIAWANMKISTIRHRRRRGPRGFTPQKTAA